MNTDIHRAILIRANQCPIITTQPAPVECTRRVRIETKQALAGLDMGSHVARALLDRRSPLNPKRK